jgi:hypothetical protein
MEIHIFKFRQDNINEELESVFNLDNDFSENEENFAEDTLSNGFTSESNRLAIKFCEENKDLIKSGDMSTIIERIKEYITSFNSFIFNHDDTDGDYATEFVNGECWLILAYNYNPK